MVTLGDEVICVCMALSHNTDGPFLLVALEKHPSYNLFINHIHKWQVTSRLQKLCNSDSWVVEMLGGGWLVYLFGQESQKC